jgi:hypothetical protein
MLIAQSSICNVRRCVFGLSALAFSLTLGATIASAADPVTSTYKQERAACLNGQSNQDRATCLKEVEAARGEAKRGRLNDNAASLEQNALMRCNTLPTADREDCVQRIRSGAVSGSVGGGGIYRETSRTVVDPSPPPEPMPTPSGQEIRPMPDVPQGTGRP